MSEHTRHQIIHDSAGQPLFVLVPFEEYERIVGTLAAQAPRIPHVVVRAMVKERKSAIRAWREHLGLTLEEVAARMGVTKATLSEMEQLGRSPRKSTLERIAAALGIYWEQLRE